MQSWRDGTDISVEQAGLLTGRTADQLSRIYGYEGVEALAEDLPPGARVLDAGAGSSDLGETVARLRDGISVVSMDVRYSRNCEWARDEPGMRAFLSDFEDDGPSNLALLGANVGQLPGLFPEGHFGRVFSYFMVPYAGSRVVRHMLAATEPGGKVSLGPLNRCESDPVAVPGGLLEFHYEPPNEGEGGSSVTAESPEDRSLIPELAAVITRYVHQKF